MNIPHTIRRTVPTPVLVVGAKFIIDYVDGKEMIGEVIQLDVENPYDVGCRLADDSQVALDRSLIACGISAYNRAK